MHTKLFSENLKETGHLEDLGVGRRITHAPYRNRVGGCGLHLSGSEQEPVEGKENFGFHKMRRN
jgi:hypothetical protein